MKDFVNVKNTLENYIFEYNSRLGYLGANWEQEIYNRYKDGLCLSFRVYYEFDYSVDIYIEAETWTMLNYLDTIVEKYLAKAYELQQDGCISTIIPESIEITF